MMTIREWLRRLWGTFRRTPRDADMEEELRLHVELVAEDLRRRGHSPVEAAREARLQAGGVAQAMERRRDQRGLPWLTDFIRDVHYSARSLRRAPLFTLLAVATLTLAIGANTAIFSLVDPLLFRDLPVRDPGRLVQFAWQYPGDPPLNQFGAESYALFRDRNTVFSEVAGLAPLNPVPTSGTPLDAELVTGSFFQALGVPPALGRVLDVSDDAPDALPVAVVSWRYWRLHFSGEPRALGTVITVVDPRLPEPLHATVVGVAERDFAGVMAAHPSDVWLSLGALPPSIRSKVGFALIARLKPGVSIAQARANVRVLDQPRIDDFAVHDPQWRQVKTNVTSARAGLSTPLTQQFGGPLSFLMAIVGILLLLACANLGGLCLARSAARQHEMAVRVSLGAGRFRLVRQLLTESLLLAAAGAVIGLALAPASADLLLRTIAAGTRTLGPQPDLNVALNARVLLFTASVTIAAALLFGLAPALGAFGSDSVAALGAGGRGTSPRSRRRFGSALVVGQVALSLALVSVGNLYVAHLAGLRGRSLGFDPRGVLLVSVAPASRESARDNRAAQYEQALARLRAIPGVRSVAAGGMSPISGAAGSRFVRVDGYAEPQSDRRRVSLNTVTPGYFATYGTPILSGRDFRDSDVAHPRRVIINEAMARHYFAGRDPLGQSLWFDTDRDPFEIVGVAGNAKYQNVRVAAPPTVYIYTSAFTGSADIAVRTSTAPASVAADARRVLTGIFGAGAVGRVTTLEAQVNASIVPERLTATLAGGFAIVGALLAALGLFGLLAYSVARRTQEIGVRMALGASRREVIALVVRQAARLVSAGLVLGSLLAVGSGRFAASTVEDLSAGGFLPILVAAAATLVVTTAAAWLPARRAASVDPLTALRAE